MNKNNKVNLNLKDKREMLSYQPPLLFSIPRPYEDDFERNCYWYKKMLGLEKEIKVIKDKIKAITVEHAIKTALTRQMIEKTVELNKKFINRPSIQHR